MSSANSLKVGETKNVEAKTQTSKSQKSGRRKKKNQKVTVDQHLMVYAPIEALDDLPIGMPESKVTEPPNFILPVLTRRGKEGRGYFCEICRANCQTYDVLMRHRAGKKHRVLSLVAVFNAERDKLKENKENIVVKAKVDTQDGLFDGDVDVKLSNSKDVEFEIVNNGPRVATLFRCQLLTFGMRVFSLPDRSNIQIPPGTSFRVRLHFKKSVSHGRYSTTVAFMFSDPKVNIVREVSMHIRNAEMHALLGPTSPYKHPPRISSEVDKCRIIGGLPLEKHPAENALVKKIELKNYFIEPSLRRDINHGLLKEDLEDAERSSRYSPFKKPLGRTNYKERFSLLLHLEEAQMEVDIRKYDMREVQLSRYRENRSLLSLTVPGLAENRPSVLRGDRVVLRTIQSDGKPDTKHAYEGVAHVIGMNEVHLGLHQKFVADTWLPNMKFTCRFNFSRFPIRLQHRAVQLAVEHSLEMLFLFPIDTTVCMRRLIQPLDSNINFYNRLIGENSQQALAVRHIVSGSSRPAPFLVFGPPGTGKTVTMVEAMKQVWKCVKESRILACAPSNNAADLLAERLIEHIPKNKLLRLNAFSREWTTVPEKIKDCCNYKGRSFHYPKLEELMKYSVIVSTLVTAGRLVSANFPSGHFTHIFIDEAGQAIEPEAMIPIAGIFESDILVPNGGQVVFAGDPEQLGPVLRSPLALKYGLGISILERYMKTVDVYKRKERVDGHETKDVQEAYDERLVVKLVRNYRSHPEILRIPNESFYLGELEPHADTLARESLCQWSELQTKGFPIIFRGIVGKDEREERSPSFFNVDEIAAVMDYVDKLLEERKFPVKAKDIGIISPYRKQVQKIKKFMDRKDRKNKYDGITVGSVEEFQGQERRVIIISTVRSSSNHLAMDFQFHLGFLKNPKRFNVAVTRAKALLIVVGNPDILSKDEHWRKLLKHCLDNKSYIGPEIKLDGETGESMDDEDGSILNDENDGTLNQIIECFNEMDIKEHTSGGNSAEISQVTQQLDPEWRGSD